jgi:Domain of unknown function (DUF4286)
MLLYNVTVAVDAPIAEEWLAWMKGTHIPEVMATGCFVRNQITRLLDPIQPDSTDETFAIQYYCESPEMLDTYLNEYAPALQKDHATRYAEKFAAFRTILEVL